MSKEKKEYEILHCNVDRELMQKLNDFCENTGLSKTVAVEKALNILVNHVTVTFELSEGKINV